MSLIRRILGGPESRGIAALAGEVNAPDGPGGPAGPGGEEGPGAQRGSGEAGPGGGGAPEGAAAPGPEEPLGRIGVLGAGGVGSVAGAGGIRGSLGSLGAARGIAGILSTLPSAPSTPGTVFVEVGSAAEQAAISRNGVQIPVVELNPASLIAALGGTVRLPARVVSQSIAPGVSVAKGTSVDITLTEPAKLNVGVLKNPFVPLAEQTLDAVYKNVIRDNASVQAVLARNTSAATLSQADQSTLTQALDTAITTDAGHTIDAAFDTLQAAFTFGS